MNVFKLSSLQQLLGRRRRLGMGLMFILAIAGILALFTGAVGIGAIQNLHRVSNEAQADQSRYMAQSGIQAALARLSATRNWPSATNPYGSGNCWSYADYNYDSDHLTLWSTTNPDMKATVHVYNNTANAFYRTSVGPGGIAIPDGRILIVSQGTFQNGAARESSTVTAMCKPAGVEFDKAAFGNSHVKIVGSTVDVVDSRVVGWTPASYTPYDIASTPQRGAEIASNSNSLNSIEFDSATKIDGNVNSGPSSALGAISYFGALVSGTDGSLATSKDNVKVFEPATAIAIGAGSVNYSGASSVLNLSPGSYKISGDLTVDSGASIVVTGPTQIYVRGDINLNSAKLNIVGKPSDLQIFGLGGAGSKVEINNSNGSIVVSAPESDAHVNSSDIFGAVNANNLLVENGTTLHYDKGLKGQYFASSDWVNDSFLGRGSTETVAITAPPAPPSDPMIPPATTGSTTSGSTTSGSTTSGSTTSGSTTSGSTTSGSTTSGSTTSGSTTSGSTTSGSTTSGSTTSGSTTSGSTTSGSTTSGSTTSGSTTSGSTTSGSTTSGSTTSGSTTSGSTTSGSTTSGSTTSGSTTSGSTTSGSTTSGSTTSGSTTSGSTTGWPKEKKMCCRDYSCGPPRCMLW